MLRCTNHDCRVLDVFSEIVKPDAAMQKNPCCKPAIGRVQPGVVVIKKYSNRRLYDTDQSRYITLEELAERIRAGVDVRVVDAKTQADLTQQTLAQIILESRGAGRLLPVPLLAQLIRMQDEHLAEFFSGYMTWALEIYLQAKRGVNQLMPLSPFTQIPHAAGDAMAKMFSALPFVRPSPPAPLSTSETSPRHDELATLRRELDELKAAVLKKGPGDPSE